MRQFLLLSFFLFSAFTSLAQAPDFKLNRTFGLPLYFAYDIAIDQADFQYILDEGQFINKFDASGTLVKTYDLDVDKKKGTAYAMALDKSGNMYVVDSALNAVKKFNPAGELVLQFGSWGNAPGKFDTPKGIAVDGSGNIYVADFTNNRVQKFDPQGKFIFQFAPSGPDYNRPLDVKVGKSGAVYILADSNKLFKLSSDGELLLDMFVSVPEFAIYANQENKLAIDDKEQIYVTDLFFKCVIQLTPQGDFIRTIKGDDITTGQLGGIRISAAFNSAGDMYTVSRSHFGYSVMQVYASDGTFKKMMPVVHYINGTCQDNQNNFYRASFDSPIIRKFNSLGVLTHQFGRETGHVDDLEVDELGNVYVLEGSGLPPRVTKFNKNGQQVGEFTSFGPPSWNRFSDLALDTQGNLYLANLYGGCINKLSPTGKFLGFIGTEGTGKGQLSRPNAVTVDRMGNIYVSDQSGNRLQRFHSNGQVSSVDYAVKPVTISFERLSSLAVDPAGNVIFWNGTGWHSKNSSLPVFDQDGKEITRLAPPSGSYGRLSINRKGNRLLVGKGYVLQEFLNGEAPQENQIAGTVFQDVNGNCLLEPGEKPIAGVVVVAEPGPYYGISDEMGNYIIPVDTGQYSVRTIVPQEPGRTIIPFCFPKAAQQVQFKGYGNSKIGVDFGNHVDTAPFLKVEIASTRRRRCFQNITTVTYANAGFAAALGAKVTVQFPESVAFLSATVPHTRDNNGNYVFEVGDLQPNQRGTLTITDSVSCADPAIRGLTVCTKAWITPGNTYHPAPNWNQADIAVSGTEQGQGQVRFVISNQGKGDMADSLAFRVFQDQELLLRSRYRLAAGDSTVLRFSPTGRAVRVEVDQPEAHPLKAMAGANVEIKAANTSGLPSVAMNAFPINNPEPEMAEECLPIIDSFDPNDKQVLPVGLTSEHFTPTNTPLRYTVRFQNTGTDVAYRVVVVDTLSTDLDLSTLQVGAVSHPYRMEVTGKGIPVLTFTFDNIMLPDSSVDEPGSNGFLQFSIKPKAGLPEKHLIENLADIFFDYNEPVRTNITQNRIYDMPLVVNPNSQLTPRGILSSPSITGFAPDRGRAGGTVTLTGKNLPTASSGSSVLFNGVAAQVLAASATELRVQVPEGAFTGKIRVLTRDGAAITSRDYTIYQPPTLTSVSPKEAKPGEIVTLHGTHFSLTLSEDTITFNGVPARVLEAAEDLLKVEVPNGATLGEIELKTLGGKVASTFSFRIWYPPTLTGLTPGKGRAGAIVALEGSNFAEEASRNRVLFGDVPANIMTATTSRLTVQVPDNAPSARIQAQTPGGVATSPTSFTFLPAPEITSFTPTSGSAGTRVTILGTHFLTDGQPDTVYFGELAAKVLQASTTELVVQAPKGVQTGEVTVAGTGGKAISSKFTVLDLAPGDAISIFPNPSRGEVTLNWFKADFALEAISMYDPMGKVILERKIGLVANDELKLTLPHLAPGVYSIRLLTSVGPVIKRIVVL